MNAQLFWIPVLCMFCLGCASTKYDEGIYWLEREHYNLALPVLQEAFRENPHFQVKRDLGIAYWGTNAYTPALELLRDVREQEPTDAKTHLYLGLTYEAQEMYKNAMDIYRVFPLIGTFSKYRRQIEARFEAMKEMFYRKEIRARINTENTIDVDEIPDNTVAVMYFEHHGDNPELAPLRIGIADFITQALTHVSPLTIVERVKLPILLDEMALGESKIIEPETAQRYGKLLGANWIIIGTYQKLAGGELQIDARLVQTKKRERAEGRHSDLRPLKEDKVDSALENEVRVTAKVGEGEREQLKQMQAELVFGILQRLKIELTDAEQIAIQRIPTRSLAALIVYSEGLSLYDRGDMEAAQRKFQEALQFDKDFEGAKSMEQKSENRQLPFTDVVQANLHLSKQQAVLERTSGSLDTDAVTEEQRRTPGPESVSSERIGAQIHINF